MLIHGLLLVSALLGVPVDDRGGGGGASGLAAPSTAVAGAVAFSTSTALALTSAGSTGQLLMSNGTAAPAFGTLTFPSTSTVNQLLYSSSANTVAGLATAASSVLVTSAGGVPSLATDLPSGVTLGGAAIRTGTVPLNVGGTNAALTADLGAIAYSTATAIAFLAHSSTTGFPLLSGNAAAPTWGALTYPTSAAAGALIYASSSSALAATAAPSASGKWLKAVAAGTPIWSTAFLLDGTSDGMILANTSGGGAGQFCSGTVAGGVCIHGTSSGSGEVRDYVGNMAYWRAYQFWGNTAANGGAAVGFVTIPNTTQIAFSTTTGDSRNNLTAGINAPVAGTLEVTDGSSGTGKWSVPGEVRDVGTTCRKGEVMIDTGGATVEICVCTATDTIRCAATTTTNPLD